MEKIDTLLEEMLDKGDPEQELDLIVRSDGDIEPHIQQLHDMQFQVRHRFRLRPGAAVRGQLAHWLKPSSVQNAGDSGGGFNSVNPSGSKLKSKSALVPSGRSNR